jgi:hypothetical protein
VRRKAKFIKPKIVIKTSNKGITPGPKAVPRPMIQNRMTTVKIVQNTVFLLHVSCTFKNSNQQFGLEFVARPEGQLDQGAWVTNIP